MILLGESFHAALGTDGQHMACTLAQGCIHTGNEFIQNIHGHECLDGAGEATAVNTVGTAAV